MERSGRSWGCGGGGCDNNNRENDNGGNIGENGEDRDCGGGKSRVSRNCNNNFGSVELGMRIGGIGSIPIPASLSNSPPPSLPLLSSASVPCPHR